jgi:hypothetical protein
MFTVEGEMLHSQASEHTAKASTHAAVLSLQKSEPSYRNVVLLLESYGVGGFYTIFLVCLYE